MARPLRLELAAALCLYHLVLETPDANLAKGMRHLNGGHTQYVNRAHGPSGTCFRAGPEGG
ncbi:MULTISPECIES: hypothetical protein [unclassified Thiocapsa]|uniref:hypothetical protein n=1 Tax=unclassified Thiocapsa TaxID=2641286 RepID=UPI0035B293CA